MTNHILNELGQPVGLPVVTALPCPRPLLVPLQGRFGRLEALRPDHAKGLFAAFAADSRHQGWTYLPEAPWLDDASAQASCAVKAASRDPLFYTILTPQGAPVGHASYLRVMPEVGSIEVGFIHFAPAMSKTALATEAMYLMMRHAFDDLGYRRYEWKCDALNAPSCAAAKRLGFTYEGTFRQATVYKGRNRDTAWFSILDTEWPEIKARFEQWLAAENFDAAGQQKRALSDFRAKGAR